MAIKDSGEKREFGTGSHRDFSEGKGRCDLLPEISVIEVLDNDFPVDPIQYHLKDAVSYIMEFKRDTSDTKPLINAAIEALIALGIDEGKDMQGVDIKDNTSCIAIGLMKVSLHYEEGAKKYGENNWKLGQPMHVFMDSGLRHCFKAIAKNNDEPHIRAAAWNFLSAIWTNSNLSDMRDLPINGDIRPVK